jgi:hypothetical protein
MDELRECQHKQLQKQLVGGSSWYMCAVCPQKFKAEMWDGKVTVAQSVPAEGAQAWLIERPGPEWATCWSGGFDWTKDSLKAIRFCRREDANQVAELFEFEDVRITEHTWE